MERLTVEKPVEEMDMTELAHNCMFAKNRWAWHRDYEGEKDLMELIREINVVIGGGELPENNTLLEEVLYDNLQYPLSDKDGFIAFIYQSLWTKADLRERLKDYEDLEVTPEQIGEMDKLYADKCRELAEYQKIGSVEDFEFYKKEHDEESYEFCGEYGTEECQFKDLIDDYRNGLLLRLPCKVGDTVYIIGKCFAIPNQLDGTLYDPEGGPGTATGYYCPYEEKCPHDNEDFTGCDVCVNKKAVFEDIAKSIWIDEDGIHVCGEETTIYADIGDTVFLSREEAEAKLAEMEGNHE